MRLPKYFICILDDQLILSPERVQCAICYDYEDPLFDSHFPGNPVVPGVVIIRSVIQIVSKFYNKPNLRLKKVNSAKFLKPIHPFNNILIGAVVKIISMDESGAVVSAILRNSDEGEIMAKMTLTLTNVTSYCVVIPTYNNADTLGSVIDSIHKYNLDVIVVNDGSTDNTAEILAGYDNISVLSYPDNKGKGYALRLGLDKAFDMGYLYAITMDSDGQHSADDILSFLKIISSLKNEALVVGNRNLREQNMPGKNTFANKFSNFWFALQTLQRVPDTQTGFRAYPLKSMSGINPHSLRYEAELEMMVRCAWKNIPIVSTPINVKYAPKGERISHFRPFTDFCRISILNTILTLLALVYFYPTVIIRYFKRNPNDQDYHTYFSLS